MARPAEVLDDNPSITNGHHPVAVGELYDVSIGKLVYGGDGLAHIGSQAVFVPYAAVGAVIVVPLWLISVLLRLGRRHNRGPEEPPS